MAIRFKVKAGSAAGHKTPLLAVIRPEGKGEALHGALGEAIEAQLARLERRRKANGGDGEAETLLALPDGAGAESLLVLELDQIRHMPAGEKLRTAAAKAVRAAERVKAATVTIALDGPAGAAAAGAVAEGCLLGGYRFEKYKSKKNGDKPLTVELLVASRAQARVKEAIARAEKIAAGVSLARDLVNEPPSELVPGDLAAAARAMAREEGLQVEVLDEKALIKNGYMGTVTVGRASAHRPCMMILRYGQKIKSPVHLVLVGKAITFDTGGICIKPAKDMWEMKGDMAGGGAVIGAMKAIARLRPDIRVTAIVPSAQNAIGRDALLPGDIIRAKNGKTVHVDNTDAEGRLILMDALIRAKEEGATHVVDAATLTGSVVRALGPALAGIFGTDQELVDQVIAAGRAVGEDYWQLPLVDEYRDMLKSDIGDLDNSGRSPNAGSIVAALFLREFVDPSLKWAHLDIAGPFLLTKPWRYFRPGGTGFGVRTFVELAERLAAEK